MSDWIFHFSRNSLRLPMGIFVRKIHFDGIENFKKDVPVLLACNHPNSFLDGVIFEHFSKRKVYTLARGDAFLKPVTNYIFRGMRLLPIFRASDASAEVARKGNAQTMDELYGHFQKDHSILIFTEGRAYPEKAIRKLKKGTGQIAADMAKRSDYKMNLHVVPTSLNYSKFGTLMQTVHVTYGEPIPVLDYVDMIKNDEKGFVEMVTNKVQEGMEAGVVVTKGDFTDEKDFAHEILVNENYEPLTYKIKDRWKYSIGKLNTMSSSLSEKIKSYKAGLTEHGILDANVGNRSFDFVSALIAILTMGVSLPIYFIWYLIWIGIDKFVKAKFRNVVFQDSMKVGFGMILSLILVGITGAVINKFVPSYWPWLFTFLGIYGAICWFRFVESFPYLWKELKWAGIKDNEKAELIAQRDAILSELM
ncbi:MAG: 1-acyl-sn-glycerol-3-phosphate acyltransferase [Bacteroidia bacterium]